MVIIPILPLPSPEEILNALPGEDLIGQLGEDGVDGQQGHARPSNDPQDHSRRPQHLPERRPLDLPHLLPDPAQQ
ncbi:hypothetical protein CRG98_048842, partial [Punica granatum]